LSFTTLTQADVLQGSSCDGSKPMGTPAIADHCVGSAAQMRRANASP
jgi:hypothetical protein